MVTAGDFRNGVTFDDNGVVLQVIEFQHVKPGKGAAFVRTKLRNVMTGAVIERTFSPTDKFQDARYRPHSGDTVSGRGRASQAAPRFVPRWSAEVYGR